ncbi:uncharacterized protein LOC129738299 isoform X2 [Uranotaenia lowii]|uniref:uncharacterized protein LOC129738299 isoform X2 n=1 Tax=Uranotaenia lowii TaxID=190385 RepID=UPI002479637B|nr:uncharacterized protein LOC129738299 isoform X2 [Uranotaenia lowii]
MQSKCFHEDEMVNMEQRRELAEQQPSVEEIRDVWRELVKQRMALVCFREGADDIVGMNVTYVSCVDDAKDYKSKGDRWQDVVDAVLYITEQSKVFERFDVTEYLTAMGLSVSPRYRGRGIATEILRARVPLAQAVGVKLTSTVFTAIGSQIPAAKVGFVETFVMDYDKLAELDPRFTFPGIQSKSCKSMSLRIE